MKDQWLLYQSEADDLVGEMVGDTRIGHWWRSIFEIKTLSGERKYSLIEKVVKSVSLHNGYSAVERSLSDNKRTADAERDHLMEQVIINLRRMKEYARANGGAEKVVVSEKMIQGMTEAKRKDEERLGKEREAKEEVERTRKRQEEEEKKKQQMIKVAAKSRRKLEEKEKSAEKDEEKLDEELEIAKRTLGDVGQSLKTAIEKKDTIGMKIASELVESSQKKIEAVSELRKKQLKERTAL